MQAAVRGGGVWQLAITDIPATFIEPVAIPAPFSLYPNPGRGIFYFTGAKQGSSLVVYDVLGRIINTIEATGNSGSVNLNGQANGVYFYTVINNNTVTQQGKIVID